MYRRYILMILLGGLLFSKCSVPETSSIDAPDSLYVLPKDSFLLLLKDIHLADAYLSTLTVDELKDSIINPENIYGSIFKKYHLTNKQFQETILYYSYHIDQFDSIYADLLKEMNIINDSLQNAKQQE